MKSLDGSLLVGKKFGRLTVVSQLLRDRNHHWYACRCDCGGVRVTRGETLTSGDCKSCGCLPTVETVHGETIGKHLRTSGTYKSWVSMRSRCNTPSATGYMHYGGRGVTVCAAWGSYEQFVADMGVRPEGHSLDRIDPYGNYTPENCRWATIQVQNNNKRKK